MADWTASQVADLAIRAGVPRLNAKKCPDCRKWLLQSWSAADGQIVLLVRTRHRVPNEDGGWMTAGADNQALFVDDTTTVRAWCRCQGDRRSHLFTVAADGGIQFMPEAADD